MNKFVHLTNFSINKRATNFVKNTDKHQIQPPQQEDGNISSDDSSDDENKKDTPQISQVAPTKWDFKMLKTAYEKAGINYQYVHAQFKDLIMKTLMSVEPTITANLQKNPTSRNNCFELYGFDISWTPISSLGCLSRMPTPCER